MELSNRRKGLYITVSILLAFVIWFYVDSTNGTTVKLSIKDIPVELLNEDTTLADKGLMVVSGYDTTVDLELEMPRTLVYGFDEDEVGIIADLSGINTAGWQSVSYSISYPTGVSSRNITVKSPNDRRVRLQIGELFRNYVDVRCKVVGNLADGYVAGNVQLLPATLELRGQQTDIMAVSYAQVTLNVENANSTVVELLEYELYGFNDELIVNSRIHPANKNIQVTMPVISAKEVPLSVEFVEAPGVRLSSFDYALDVDTILLSGDASELARIDGIVLDTVALEEITEETTLSYELEIPSRLNNLSGVTAVTLTIAPRDIATRTIEVPEFGIEGYEGEREVRVATDTLGVVLRGTAEDLAALEAGQVHVTADLTEVGDAIGIYTVPAIVTLDGEPDVGTVGEYELTVRISDPEPEAPEETGEEQGNEDDADRDG